MQERRMPRDDEGDTVSYSGVCLAELLAASGENDALDAVDALDDLECVESTVVIPGSRPSSLPLATTPEPVSGSFAAVAYTVAPRPAVDAAAPRRGLAGPGVALLLASVGLLIGLWMGKTISTDAPHRGHALAAQPQPQPQPREPLAETTPLVSPTHQKNATKRRCRVVGSIASPIAHGSAVASAASTGEATSEAQQLEDRRLLLAAEAERSF